jgi:hypothetical protein
MPSSRTAASFLRSQAGRVALSLGALAALAFCGDRLLGRVLADLADRDRAGPNGGRIQRVLQGDVKPFLLVVGSSRAAHGVDPAAFPFPAFNLGHDGRHLYWASGVLGLLEERGALPPAILLHLDREAFQADSAQLYTLQDRRFLRLFRRPGNWVDRDARRWPLEDRLKFLSAAYPFNGEVFYLLDDFRRLRQGREPIDGFEPFPRGPGDSAALETMAGRSRSLLVENAPASRAYLDVLVDVIERAHRRGVFLAAFTAPDYADHPQAFASISGSLDSLLAARGVPYLDFNRDTAGAAWGNRLFRDAAHVNAEGAAKVTAGLREWLARFPQMRMAGGERSAK